MFVLKNFDPAASTSPLKTQAVFHPEGDVTSVFKVPGKATVKIGDAESRWRGCCDKNRLSMVKGNRINQVNQFLNETNMKNGIGGYWSNLI